MVFALLLFLLVAIGGVGLTYLIDEDEPLLWRLAAGAVISSAVCGTAGFVLGSAIGFGQPAVVLAMALTLVPLLLLLSPGRKKLLGRDMARAKGKIEGANAIKLVRFVYYAFFVALFVFFFDRAMIVTDQGIFTGGSNNLGDLPFHLGAIFSFTEGNLFPPENPNFAGAKFSYPFIADLVTAMFMKLGVGVREAMLVQNVAWALSLLVILERLVLRLTNDRVAAKVAPFLLFFSGGFGFVWFLGDYWAQSRGFLELFSALPRDYTIGDEFRWGNSLITLFLTQRSLLLGMPITLIVIGFLWKVFLADESTKTGKTATVTSGKPPISWIFREPNLIIMGLLSGMLVLIHLHSLAALFVVCSFLLVIRPDRSRTIRLLIFGAFVALVAVPELVWSMTGSATKAREFVGWHFGWDSRDDNVVWFWLKNTGLVIPFIALGVYLIVRSKGESNIEPESTDQIKRKHKKRHEDKQKGTSMGWPIVMFYIPFAFLFVVSNTVKFAPWEWDNIKILIYWYVMSIPFVAFAVAWAWNKNGWARISAIFASGILIFSGSLDVWRTVSGQINYRVFDSDAITVANRIRASTRPDSLFLNAPTYNSAVVLSGRPSLMRYSGHLSSHGIDYSKRESDVRSIYRGGPQATALIREYGIEFVLISPEERNTLAPNESYFAQFPVIAESGQYKVYRVRSLDR